MPKNEQMRHNLLEKLTHHMKTSK